MPKNDIRVESGPFVLLVKLNERITLTPPVLEKISDQLEGVAESLYEKGYATAVSPEGLIDRIEIIQPKGAEQ